MMLIAIKPIKRSFDAKSTVMQSGLSLLDWRHEGLSKKEGGSGGEVVLQVLAHPFKLS